MNRHISENRPDVYKRQADFLAADMKRGIIPSTFLPLQSGVGNIANAVLGALGRDKTIPAFEMYTEVIQHSVIGLILSLIHIYA